MWIKTVCEPDVAPGPPIEYTCCRLLKAKLDIRIVCVRFPTCIEFVRQVKLSEEEETFIALSFLRGFI